MTVIEIRGGVELPAVRTDIELHTSDGLTLVGELAVPQTVAPVATLVFLHPLPTGGGFMDSHIIRKAAARLPALADLAVLRFNFRGVSSPRGTSEGSFGEGILEEKDLAAAMAFVAERGLPHPWLVGWSFGTEVTLKYGLQFPIDGAILLSPPLIRTTDAELARWSGSGSAWWRSCRSLTTTCVPTRPGSDSRSCPRRSSSQSTEPASLGGGDAGGSCDERDRGPGQSRGQPAADHLRNGTLALVLPRDDHLIDDQQTDAATGIAMRAPRTPSSVPPARAAMTTTTPGTETAVRMMRGLITYASTCR